MVWVIFWAHEQNILTHYIYSYLQQNDVFNMQAVLLLHNLNYLDSQNKVLVSN